MVKSTKDSTLARWKILGIVPIILAALAVVFLVKTKSGPSQQEEKEISRVMRVIKVPRGDLIPRATGYGAAEPGRVWRAVAEVRGRVIETHPDLKAGALLKKDDVLLKVDPAEYELAIAVTQANIAQARADFAEFAAQEENTRLALEIEKRSMLLAQQALKRKQSLLADNGISANEVDQEERNVLMQNQNVQNLENTLNLIPSRERALHAKLAAHEAGLKQARLDLAKTVIAAPFDCRMGKVSIEPGQYLVAGQALFEIHGTAVSEIETQIAGEQLRHLIGVQGDLLPQQNMYQEAMADLTRIKAIVRIRSGSWNIEWEAHVDRLREEVDPQTRAFNVIVAVDQPYQKVIPGKRPPLTRGLFTQVELQGLPRPESVVIPRSALHGEKVFVLDELNRLQPVMVTPAFMQSNLAVIASGLVGGETLIVSDPAPAIAGMLVMPILDEELQQGLIAQARAETVLQ